MIGGESIAVDESLDPADEPADIGEGEPAEFQVAWEDEHLLVVDKPPGVVVHPARGHRSGTLAQALAGRAAGFFLVPGIELGVDIGIGDIGVPAAHQLLQALPVQREHELGHRSAEVIASNPTSRRASASSPTAAMASGATAPL